MARWTDFNFLNTRSIYKKYVEIELFYKPLSFKFNHKSFLNLIKKFNFENNSKIFLTARTSLEFVHFPLGTINAPETKKKYSITEIAEQNIKFDINIINSKGKCVGVVNSVRALNETNKQPFVFVFKDLSNGLSMPNIPDPENDDYPELWVNQLHGIEKSEYHPFINPKFGGSIWERFISDVLNIYFYYKYAEYNGSRAYKAWKQCGETWAKKITENYKLPDINKASKAESEENRRQWVRDATNGFLEMCNVSENIKKEITHE